MQKKGKQITYSSQKFITDFLRANADKLLEIDCCSFVTKNYLRLSAVVQICDYFACTLTRRFGSIIKSGFGLS